jgi:hypothetical protein
MTYPRSKLPNDQPFRILQLRPGSADDPVFFTLLPATLSHDEPRTTSEAISYTWAVTSLTHEIYYQDPVANQSRCLKVTASCCNALKSLRLPSQPRDIWVDAVCISQMDLEERNLQVGLIRAVYSGAHQVEMIATLLCVGWKTRTCPRIIR